jgi:hypothetical protein
MFLCGSRWTYIYIYIYIYIWDPEIDEIRRKSLCL